VEAFMESEAEFAEAGQVQPNCIVGLRYREDAGPARIGRNAVIRAGTVIYGDVSIGDNFNSGHNVLIRERTTIGEHVGVGTNSVIDGQVVIGNFVKIESNCYIPTHTTLGCRVFLGPGVTLTNDRYPLKLRDEYVPTGPIIEDGVTLGAAVVVLPGVRIGHDSFVAAGTVVTRDVPPFSLVRGVPGRVMPSPEKLRERNLALSWRKYLAE
jgi:acetyltransferase-like isoleucine patch superfamily enzyme